VPPQLDVNGVPVPGSGGGLKHHDTLQKKAEEFFTSVSTSNSVESKLEVQLTALRNTLKIIEGKEVPLD
jgi:hypothetical protein